MNTFSVSASALGLCALVFSLFIPLLQVQAAVVPADIMVSYELDGNGLDASPNGDHADINGPSFVPSANGQAGDFDGLDDFMVSQNPISINSNNLTMETSFAWDGGTCHVSSSVRTNDVTDQCGVIGMSDDYPAGQLCVNQGGRYWMLSFNTTTKQLSLHWNNDGCDASTRRYWTVPGLFVEPDTEYHVVVTMDNGDLVFYLNGAVVRSDDTAWINGAFDQELQIGRGSQFYNNGSNLQDNDRHYFFSGTIDFARLYSRALTTGEVNSLFGLPTLDPGDIEAKVNIQEGEVTIGAPSLIQFPDTGVSDAEQTVDVTVTDHFFVKDLKAAAAGYFTTLSVSDMVDGSKTIAADNMEIRVENGTVEALEGTADSNVTVPTATQTYTQFTSSSPVTLLQRSTDSSGLVGKYGVLPDFQLTIPAYQSLGSYTATMTYTLIEN